MDGSQTNAYVERSLPSLDIGTALRSTVGVAPLPHNDSDEFLDRLDEIIADTLEKIGDVLERFPEFVGPEGLTFSTGIPSTLQGMTVLQHNGHLAVMFFPFTAKGYQCELKFTPEATMSFHAVGDAPRRHFDTPVERVAPELNSFQMSDVDAARYEQCARDLSAIGREISMALIPLARSSNSFRTSLHESEAFYLMSYDPFSHPRTLNDRLHADGSNHVFVSMQTSPTPSSWVAGIDARNLFSFTQERSAVVVINNQVRAVVDTSELVGMEQAALTNIPASATVSVTRGPIHEVNAGWTGRRTVLFDFDADVDTVARHIFGIDLDALPDGFTPNLTQIEPLELVRVAALLN